MDLPFRPMLTLPLAGAYRDAVKAHHPDVGGDEAMFMRLTQARNLLLGEG